MTMQVHGIHHVTAIAGDPQANVDFYAGVLGLRLVKVTVNYDDPHTYHLYYGDDVGQPGTILTFFPWPGAPRGRTGTGQVTGTSFAIPGGSLGFWADRLRAQKLEYAGPSSRFDEEVIALQDPDGLQLELVTSKGAPDTTPRPDGTIPGKYAIQRFQGVTVTVEGYERTAGQPLPICGGGSGHPGKGRSPLSAQRPARPRGRGNGAPHRLAHARRRNAASLALPTIRGPEGQRFP
jgi:glyoxalase family protein